MKHLRILLCVAWPGLSGCGPLYDDSGSADPIAPWPWVCPDGRPAPDSGCLPAPNCPDGGAIDAGADGDC
jgi:hypothetical protein